ncbi:MAG: hypothetical protein Kow00124_27850 [Anaerolineae bacterium]
MSDERPIIAARRPSVLDLEPGRVYLWCACGRSEHQPWCDDSHRGTRFQPVRIEVTAPRRAALCRCKHSSKRPYCDGSHGDV